MKRKLYACVIALSCVALGLAVTACSGDKEVQDERGASEAFSMPSESSEADKTEDAPAALPTEAPKPTPVMRLEMTTEYGYDTKYETPYGSYGEERVDQAIYEYDEEGKVTIEFRRGSITLYEYNDNDQLTQIVHAGDNTITETFEYDGDRLIHSNEDSYICYDDWTYEYDESGVRISGVRDHIARYLHEPPVKSLTKTLYFYDDEGRIIREEEYEWDGRNLGDPVTILTYEYDGNGKLIRDEKYFHEDDSTATEEFEYDEYGSVTRRCVTHTYNDPEKVGPGAVDNKFEFFYDNVYTCEDTVAIYRSC